LKDFVGKRKTVDLKLYEIAATFFGYADPRLISLEPQKALNRVLGKLLIPCYITIKTAPN
jgi:hypothetical protein